MKVALEPGDVESVSRQRTGGHLAEIAVQAGFVRSPDLQAGLEPSGELVNQGEDAFGLALDLLRSQYLAASGILHPDADADRLPGSAEASQDYGVDLGGLRQPASDLQGGRLARAELFNHLLDALGRERAQPGRLGEVGDHHLGQPEAKPIERGIAAMVLEIENRHRPRREDRRVRQGRRRRGEEEVHAGAGKGQGRNRER
jgi:hypothetical protein